MTIPTDLYIGGRWVPSSSGRRFDVENPATRTVMASVADAEIEDARSAAAAAEAAAERWRDTAPRERAELLRALFEEMTARTDEIADLIVAENGKPLGDARAEAAYAAEFFRWYSEEAVRLPGFLTTSPSENLRDRALWEEEFTLDEPIVEGGHTEFKKLHTIGFDGWTVSKYRQFGGPTPDGDPENIVRDMDLEGVDASVMFPNLSLFVDLHFVMTEFNANWLVSYFGFMDKAWRTGIGQDPDWWLGFWDDDRAPKDQPAMGQLFNINGQWPYPLKPSEYLRRQIHVQLADDRVAVQARHITGMSTLVWGNDYPHAEGTFRGSEECVADNFAGVPDDEKAVILGHTLAGLVGLDSSKKIANTDAARAEQVSA